MEATFFQQDPFFGSEAVAGMGDRFGVDALRAQLSKQLVSLTQRELPRMKAAVEEVLEQVSQGPGVLMYSHRSIECSSSAADFQVPRDVDTRAT